jgi:hypothetical protein
MSRLSKKQKQKAMLEKLEGNNLKVWDCKVGYADSCDLPGGADYPMRRAIETAFKKLTGRYPDFMFTGWGGELTPIQKSIVDEDIQRKMLRKLEKE